MQTTYHRHGNKPVGAANVVVVLRGYTTGHILENSAEHTGGWLGTVSKIPWSQWSEIFFTSPLTPSPPPLRGEIPSYFWLHSMMVNKSMKPIFWEKFWEIWGKYFTSLASRYFWDGPLLKSLEHETAGSYYGTKWRESLQQMQWLYNK